MDDVNSEIESSPDSEPGDRPLYGRRRRIFIRVIVLVAVGSMLLPLLANFYAVSASTAAHACLVATNHEAPEATGAVAIFEIFGPGVIGWECYATGAFGGDRHIISLGLLPGTVEIPRGVQT